eukprot:931110_1
MSVQLALLFTIWITQHVHNTNAKKQKQDVVAKRYINFGAYKKEWKDNGIPFHFLTRAEEKIGERGMFLQNAEATQTIKDLIFKHHYILIPVGSTTSQPLIAKNGRVKKFEIPYADQFGAREPYPKLDIIKKFVQGIRDIRKVKFPIKKEKVPVIFIKSISFGLKPVKTHGSYKTWCEKQDHYMQQIKPPTPNTKPDDENSKTTTYTKLKYVTNKEDNFYIFLPDKCGGYILKKTGKKVPIITFAWADYFASELAKKPKNKDHFVAVGDIGGGSNPTVVKYKGGLIPTDRDEKKAPAYAHVYDSEGKPKDLDKSANQLFEGTQKICKNPGPKSNQCIEASKTLAGKFIKSIKKVAKKLNINEKSIQVKQTGGIRKVYYEYLKYSMTYEKEKANKERLKKQLPLYKRLLNKVRRPGAHVGLSDYYYGYGDEYNQYDYDDYSNEYDEYEEYEYDNDNIDSLYYEAANNLLTAENNFDMAQKIKQKYDANKQKNGYY